ncbi:MAG: hypothetical protein ACYS9X_24965 [Planctomycetota bacterium]|jgi:hypothetical protein
MRYSYCWSLDGAAAGEIAASPRSAMVAAADGYEDRFVVLRGAPTGLFGVPKYRGARWLDGTPLFWHVAVRRGPKDMRVVAVPSREDWELVSAPGLSRRYWEHCREVVYGRVTFHPVRARPKPGAGGIVIVLGPTRSSNNSWTERSRVPLTVAVDGRWHPSSVGGLAVGAMGVFIFGLYVRGWLRERRALAREPGRDMIAWA